MGNLKPPGRRIKSTRNQTTFPFGMERRRLRYRWDGRRQVKIFQLIIPGIRWIFKLLFIISFCFFANSKKSLRRYPFPFGSYKTTLDHRSLSRNHLQPPIGGVISVWFSGLVSHIFAGTRLSKPSNRICTIVGNMTTDVSILGDKIVEETTNKISPVMEILYQQGLLPNFMDDAQHEHDWTL